MCSSFLSKNAKVPIKGLDLNRREDMEEVYYDPSRPIKPSIGENLYAAHFMEPTNAVSDIKFLNKEDQLAHNGRDYISQVESRFSAKRTQNEAC